MQPLKIALFCGGVTQERGISLNSARSFLDHISPYAVQLSIYYLNPHNQFYRLTSGQLYSNTPSDFDFKLSQENNCLSPELLLNELQFIDLVFPLIHGKFGEDGELQKWLETHKIPFVGSSSIACYNVFNKYRAKMLLTKNGFNTLPFQQIDRPDTNLNPFFQKFEKAIIKPTESGSSIGVKFASTPQMAKQAIESLWNLGFRELILEPYCEDSEFTVCVVESHLGSPTALLPIEINTNKEEGSFLDYRKKYLPNEQTRYYCPPRYSPDLTESIRLEASRLFKCAGLSDFARIDGWAAKDGTIRISDINPISGMEQNSFLFQQASRIGMSHSELLGYIIENALKRAGNRNHLSRIKPLNQTKKAIYILMGGSTSERQVSLMSGTNVWLKLLHSDKFDPIPFLWDTSRSIWQLPYSHALHHTVEEMTENCRATPEILPQVNAIRANLALSPLSHLQTPRKMNLKAWMLEAKEKNAFAFLALHGGKGEDGSLQETLQRFNIPFNGSDALGSRICMDKHRTARTIAALQNPHILPMNQISILPSTFFNQSHDQWIKKWNRFQKKLKSKHLIIKPQSDGCSTGVSRLESFEDFATYLECIRSGKGFIPAHTLKNQPSIIEMPKSKKGRYLIEPFISTDKVFIEKTTLHHTPISGWCEMTIGVLENLDKYTALNPSLTVTESHVLSLEEKFQGGTGINITPPPDSILSPSALHKVQASACLVAKALKIQGYARLDLFVECASGTIRVIEANTLPALTPSTVLYHQALSMPVPIPPKALIEQFIANKLNN